MWSATHSPGGPESLLQMGSTPHRYHIESALRPLASILGVRAWWPPALDIWTRLTRGPSSTGASRRSLVLATIFSRPSLGETSDRLGAHTHCGGLPHDLELRVRTAPRPKPRWELNFPPTTLERAALSAGRCEHRCGWHRPMRMIRESASGRRSTSARILDIFGDWEGIVSSQVGP